MAIDTQDPCTLYWAEAKKAIKEGLLTHDDAVFMARAGTRKQRYWAGHLARLRTYLAGRKEQACPQTSQ